MTPFHISRVTEVTAPLVQALGELLPQLSPHLTAPSEERLRRMLADGLTVLLAACAEERIVGVLTLVWYDLPSGRKGWIEDVVVDAAARGAGLGEALVRRALDVAAEAGVERVMLTSNAARKAARALYRKCGFKEAETTVFARKTDSKQ